jgi:hypothetical protein
MTYLLKIFLSCLFLVSFILGTKLLEQLGLLWCYAIHYEELLILFFLFFFYLSLYIYIYIYYLVVLKPNYIRYLN